MSHSTAHVWIHIVWNTYCRERTLTRQLATLLEEHMKAYALERRIHVHAIAVQPEHVHCLIELLPTQRLDEVVQLLKGESSHWINQNGLLRERFWWGRGYWAGSVDRRGVGRVIRYIQNQEEHHRTFSFAEEAKSLLPELGLDPSLADETHQT